MVFRYYLHAGVFRSVSTWSTNLATLGLSRLANLPFPFPPLAIQRQIAVEAKRRLEASREQEQAVRASLDRLPALEAELLATAVSGALVPQDPQDEDAEALLQRLGPPPKEVEPRVPDLDRAGSKRMMTTAASKGSDVDTGPRLRAVLRSAGKPLRVPELFSQAGFDRDSIADVEQFYLELRDELGRSIRAIGGDGEDALLETVIDAAL